MAAGMIGDFVAALSEEHPRIPVSNVSRIHAKRSLEGVDVEQWRGQLEAGLPCVVERECERASLATLPGENLRING